MEELCIDVAHLLKRRLEHYRLDAVVEIVESSVVRNTVIGVIEKLWGLGAVLPCKGVIQEREL